MKRQQILLKNLEIAKYNLEEVAKLMQEYIEIDEEELRTNEDKKMLEHYSYMLSFRKGQWTAFMQALDILNKVTDKKLIK